MCSLIVFKGNGGFKTFVGEDLQGSLVLGLWRGDYRRFQRCSGALFQRPRPLISFNLHSARHLPTISRCR